MLGGLINDKIRTTVLPGQSGASGDATTAKNHNALLFEKVNIEEYIIKTEDGSELYTFRIEPKKQLAKRIDILHFLGNSQTVEAVLPQLVELSFINDCHITTFNYRGVSTSRGTASNINDLVSDCIAQVESLFEKGVKAKKLIISGFSLGGGLATKVVNHYHKIGKKIYLFNDRSFGRLSDVASAWYGKYLRVFFRKLLNLFNWEIDADKLYSQIPAKYKRHINLIGADDEVVPFYASLSKRLKDLRQRVNEEFLFHCLDEYSLKGHKAPLAKIINKYGETGERLFSKFIEEIRNQISKK